MVWPRAAAPLWPRAWSGMSEYIIRGSCIINSIIEGLSQVCSLTGDGLSDHIDDAGTWASRILPFARAVPFHPTCVHPWHPTHPRRLSYRKTLNEELVEIITNTDQGLLHFTRTEKIPTNELSVHVIGVNYYKLKLNVPSEQCIIF